MILRVFRAVVHEGKQEEFQAFFLNIALPLIRSQNGLVSVSVGLPLDETSCEFCMVMTWRDVDSIRRFAGEGWREAVVHPDEAHLLRETRVEHYLLADDALATPPGTVD